MVKTNSSAATASRLIDQRLDRYHMDLHHQRLSSAQAVVDCSSPQYTSLNFAKKAEAGAVRNAEIDAENARLLKRLIAIELMDTTQLIKPNTSRATCIGFRPGMFLSETSSAQCVDHINATATSNPASLHYRRSTVSTPRSPYQPQPGQEPRPRSMSVGGSLAGSPPPTARYHTPRTAGFVSGASSPRRSTAQAPASPSPEDDEEGDPRAVNPPWVFGSAPKDLDNPGVTQWNGGQLASSSEAGGSTTPRSNKPATGNAYLVTPRIVVPSLQPWSGQIRRGTPSSYSPCSSPRVALTPRTTTYATAAASPRGSELDSTPLQTSPTPPGAAGEEAQEPPQGPLQLPNLQARSKLSQETRAEGPATPSRTPRMSLPSNLGPSAAASEGGPASSTSSQGSPYPRLTSLSGGAQQLLGTFHSGGMPELEDFRGETQDAKVERLRASYQPVPPASPRGGARSRRASAHSQPEASV